MTAHSMSMRVCMKRSIGRSCTTRAQHARCRTLVLCCTLFPSETGVMVYRNTSLVFLVEVNVGVASRLFWSIGMHGPPQGLNREEKDRT